MQRRFEQKPSLAGSAVDLVEPARRSTTPWVVASAILAAAVVALLILNLPQSGSNSDIQAASPSATALQRHVGTSGDTFGVSSDTVEQPLSDARFVGFYRVEYDVTSLDFERHPPWSASALLLGHHPEVSNRTVQRSSENPTGRGTRTRLLNERGEATTSGASSTLL